MKRCDRLTSTQLSQDGQGQSVAVVIVQPADDPGGWTIDVDVCFGDEERTVARLKSFTVSAPAGKDLTRVALIATIPGAMGYSATVTPPTPAPPTRGMLVALFCSDGIAFAPTTVDP